MYPNRGKAGQRENQEEKTSEQGLFLAKGHMAQDKVGKGKSRVGKWGGWHPGCCHPARDPDCGNFGWQRLESLP